MARNGNAMNEDIGALMVRESHTAIKGDNMKECCEKWDKGYFRSAWNAGGMQSNYCPECGSSLEEKKPYTHEDYLRTCQKAPIKPKKIEKLEYGAYREIHMVNKINEIIDRL